MGEMNPDLEVKDVSWIDADGSEMSDEAWDNGMRCFGMLFNGVGKRRESSGEASDVTLLMVFNAHHETVEFTLPPCYEAQGWKGSSTRRTRSWRQANSTSARSTK